MAGLLDQNMFDQMSAWEKAKAIGSGLLSAGGFMVAHPLQYTSHSNYPEQLKQQLASQSPNLGLERVNRSPLDMAINYGGGYQFGSLPSADLESADKMAKAYQLIDYLYAETPKQKQDAWKDYQENMAGVRAAIANKRVGKKVDIPTISTQYAKGF